MEWWIIATLAVLLLLLSNMYRISIRENRELINCILLALLDETSRASQRAAVIAVVQATGAKNADELGGKVCTAVTKLAAPLASTWPRTYGLLWNSKTYPPTIYLLLRPSSR
jgi:hypothetical protein